jgi:molybdenum cofactor cytidylyltransferase
LLVSELVGARLAAVILAAGDSRRMGTPKALLPWGGTTLLEHAIQQARAAQVSDIVVVLGPATQHLELTDVTIRLNPDPETGRSASIRLGSQDIPDDVDAILIQSVDQPCEADVLESLFTALAHGTHTVAIPKHAGRRGHPICLSGSLLAELRAVTEAEQGLRALVIRHAEHVLDVPVSTPSVVWNLNDPAAYAAARDEAGRQ